MVNSLGAGTDTRADHALPDTAVGAPGSHLDGADEIVQESDSSKGFETVTFRGYDPDGELLARVVVEHGPPGWFVGSIETCEG